MKRPFDKTRYARLLEGLEVTVLNFRTVLVNNDKLRLDSGYFAKLPVETQTLVEARPHASMGNLCSKFRKGIFDIKAESYVDEGVPFVRIGDLRGGLIRSGSVAHITIEAHQSQKSTALRFGDVVLSKTAYPAAALVNIPECNVSQDTIAVRLSVAGKRLCNGAVLVAYLNSKYGMALMQRQFQGNVQEHLSLPDGRKIPVPLFGAELQSRIKRSLLSADANMRKARAALVTAESAISDALGLIDWQPPQSLSYTRRASRAFAAGRLDAEYFKEEFDAARAALIAAGATKFVPLEDLLSALTNGHTPLRHDLSVGEVPFLCAEHVSDFEVHYNSDKRILARHHQSELARTRLRNGDVLLSIKGRVGNFALVENVPGDVNINQDVALLRFKRTLPVWWVLAFLNSPFGKLQVQQHCTGGINPFLGLGNVRKLEVPVFPDGVMRSVGEQAQESVSACRASKSRARELLHASQRAVEIAIEESEAAALAHLASYGVLG